MNLMSFLQPNLMSTEDLRTHLKKRFPNQNVSELQREELLRLFTMYAEPKARRATPNEDVEMEPVVQSSAIQSNGNKRSRHQAITAPTVETVTSACKRIRLINNCSTERVNQQKRQCESSAMETDSAAASQTSPTQNKRKKITWP